MALSRSLSLNPSLYGFVRLLSWTPASSPQSRGSSGIVSLSRQPYLVGLFLSSFLPSSFARSSGDETIGCQESKTDEIMVWLRVNLTFDGDDKDWGDGVEHVSDGGGDCGFGYIGEFGGTYVAGDDGDLMQATEDGRRLVEASDFEVGADPDDGCDLKAATGDGDDLGVAIGDVNIGDGTIGDGIFGDEDVGGYDCDAPSARVSLHPSGMDWALWA